MLMPLSVFGEISLEEVLDGFEQEAPPASAAPSLDEVLEGFGQTPMTDGQAVGLQPERGNAWRFSGEIDFSTAYNFARHAPAEGETDYRGRSRLRTGLELELEGDLTPGWRLHLAVNTRYDAVYQVNGRPNYSAAVLNANESETEVRSAYLQGSPGSRFDLKLGRQILVWGKSDNLRVTDILNPLDLREPGIVDIEDLRLPVSMARLDYFVGDWGLMLAAIPEVRFSKLPPFFVGDWGLMLAAIPEVRFSKLPPFGSDFYQGAAAPPPHQIPADGVANMQYALAANGIFSGWDLSFYWADVYRDQSHLVTTGTSAELRHSRINLVGAAANIALGNWLLKGEAAHLSGLRFSGLPALKRDRADMLFGIEYSGFDDTSISVERALRHLSGYDDNLAAAGYREHQWQTALRYQGDFLHARLKLTGVATYYGEALDQGGFLRLSGDYEMAEAQILTIGVIFYENGGAPPFSGIGGNDRLFAGYSFSF
jgi:hypothetical protein